MNLIIEKKDSKEYLNSPVMIDFKNKTIIQWGFRIKEHPEYAGCFSFSVEK